MKRPGRPRLVAGDTSTPITVTIPTKHFDRLCADARRRDESLAATVRRQLYRASSSKHMKT